MHPRDQKRPSTPPPLGPRGGGGAGAEVQTTPPLDPRVSFSHSLSHSNIHSLRAHKVLSEFTKCCQSSQSVVRAHGVLPELTECCESSQSVVTALTQSLSPSLTQSSQSVVRAREVLSELTECCESSQSIVRAHGVLSEPTE